MLFCPDFFLISYTVHEEVHEYSGFRGTSFGGHPMAKAMALGPDWMHLMLEGLGKDLLRFVVAVLDKGKLLESVDRFVSELNRSTNAEDVDLKYLAKGISGVSMMSAKQLPGVLLQTAIALGEEREKKIPGTYVKNIHCCIYLFFRVSRGVMQDEHTEEDVVKLDNDILEFLIRLKNTFFLLSKSKFQYYKFHMLLHVPQQMRWFGNIRVVDSNRWEAFHLPACKEVYRRTPRRTLTLYEDMDRAMVQVGQLDCVLEKVNACIFHTIVIPNERVCSTNRAVT